MSTSTVPYPQKLSTAECGAELHPAQDLVEYATAYAQQKPLAVAWLCFGVGFVLGWKLKPW
ncbi:hypothetical protein GC163_18280 [bacterium]|nr:hypothetical protein [bacterium]